jgi:hypothetical protein
MLDAAIHSVEEERLPWPDDWATSRDPADAYRCRAMWCSVLIYCLTSMLTELLQHRSVFVEERRNQSTLRDGAAVGPGWVGSRDFHMICALAGFDGTAMKERLLRAMETPQGARHILHALHSGQGRWGARDAD